MYGLTDPIHQDILPAVTEERRDEAQLFDAMGLSGFGRVVILRSIGLDGGFGVFRTLCGLGLFRGLGLLDRLGGL